MLIKLDFIVIICISLCHSQWRSVSIYGKPQSSEFSYKKLYLQLDEATLTFNADPKLVSEVTISEIIGEIEV